MTPDTRAALERIMTIAKRYRSTLPQMFGAGPYTALHLDRDLKTVRSLLQPMPANVVNIRREET